MIEKILIDYLNGLYFATLVLPEGEYLVIQGTSKLLLPVGYTVGVPCYMERPAKPPASYVLVEKTSSSESDMITTSTFAFQSVAPTLYEAAVLNEKVKAIIKTTTELKDISEAALVSDYNFTDAKSKSYRYQCVFDITHK